MIWLVGSEGMLGRLVAAELSAAGLPFHATDREVDVTDFAALRAGAPGAASPLRTTVDNATAAATGGTSAWVINCSAYTAVDQAESDRKAARALNRDAVGHLADWCARNGACMLHVSTDYVFDGSAADGYAEDAAPGPLSVYGRSKAAGEELLRARLAKHVIVRTAWLYAEHGHNFLLTMLRLLGEREELAVVNDQYGSPTYAGDLARAMVTMVGRAAPHFGTFHFTNTGCATWYDFACRIQAEALTRGLLETKRTIRPVSTDCYPTAARRPRYSALRCDRIAQVYGIRPRPWQQALADCLERMPRRAHTDDRAGGGAPTPGRPVSSAATGAGKARPGCRP